MSPSAHVVTKGRYRAARAAKNFMMNDDVGGDGEDDGDVVDDGGGDGDLILDIKSNDVSSILLQVDAQCLHHQLYCSSLQEIFLSHSICAGSILT